MNRIFKLRGLALVALAGATALAGGAWWLYQSRESSAQVSVPARKPLDRGPTGTAPLASHRVLETYAPDGTERVAPALPSLTAAVGLDSKLAFEWRLKVVNSLLQPGLPKTQIDRLVLFIQESRLPAGLSAPQLLALKNDSLNVLGLQKEFEPTLAALLAKWSHDQTLDPALRDYALQQLAGLDSARAGTGAHWQALAGEDSALASTALLHLLNSEKTKQLSGSYRVRLSAAALKMASDTTLPETSRTTALQVCGQLKLPEARPLARAVAQEGQASFPFRIAAVATLGDLGGDNETRAYLADLATGPEQRMRVPAASALKRFSIN